MNPRDQVHIVLSENVPPTWGGVARVAFSLAHALGEDGYETLLCGFDRYVADPLYRDEPFAIEPIPSAGWKKRKDWVLAALMWRLWRRYRGRGVVLYALTWKLARVVRFVARRLGWRLVVFVHGLEVTRWRRGAKHAAMMGVFRAADLCLGVSRFSADLLVDAGVPAQRVRVLNNGVDTGVFYPVTSGSGLERVRELRQRLGLEDQVIVLTLARVIERKGQDSVIRALARLRESQPENAKSARYVIAGRGPEKEVQRLRELAEGLGVSDSVVFWGFVPAEDIRVFYNACDLYVMNSRVVSGEDVEGFGITFLEAAACGKPVIGGRSGGVPDAIADGTTGYLVDPADVVELSDRLGRLIADPRLRTAMGEAGLRRAREQFSVQAVKDRLVQFLLELPEA
ncbi:MAG: glycosyltransferase family 4 protein [Pseudomonadota bacterium]|nr:glycosyltransferase family 4 protein [Pseudomonadota bacterium]